MRMIMGSLTFIFMVGICGCRKGNQHSELTTIEDKVVYLLSKLETSPEKEEPLLKNKKYWVRPYLLNVFFSQMHGLSRRKNNRSEVIAALRKQLNSKKEAYRYWSAEVLLFLQIDIPEVKKEIKNVPATLSEIPKGNLMKSIEINMVPDVPNSSPFKAKQKDNRSQENSQEESLKSSEGAGCPGAQSPKVRPSWRCNPLC